MVTGLPSYDKRADIHEAFLSLGCALICWQSLRNVETRLEADAVLPGRPSPKSSCSAESRPAAWGLGGQAGPWTSLNTYAVAED